MSLWQKKPKIKALAQHTFSLPYFTGQHLLSEVKNGAKKLVVELSRAADAKKLALSFAGENVPATMRQAAFRVLAGIKGDPEIEDLFVDYLVECEDKGDPLRIIADRYWD